MNEKEYGPVELAYLGDSVYETAVRKALVTQAKRNLKDYNKLAMSVVRASAQCRGARLIEPLLSAEEADVMRRGRNAKCGNVPKSATVDEYRHATGLEALMGWLYLHGRNGRVEELVSFIAENELGSRQIHN